jgi:carboxypeptidase Taq
MNALQAYEELTKRSREIAHLESAMELAYWDQRTSMPYKGHAHRVRHLKAIAKMRYRRFIDPRIDEMLSTVESSSMVRNSMSIESVNTREWRRVYNRLKKIPAKLAAELVRAGAEAEAVWEKTRQKNDWARFKPYLEKVVDLKREEARAIGFDHEPYDALLSEYEPDETADTTEALLVTLRPALVELSRRVHDNQSKRKEDLAEISIPVHEQEDFVTAVARRLGYSLESGRIDVSSHPFSTGLGPGDVRIVSRFDEKDLREGLFAVAHEVGHAFYAQGLPLDHWGEPICRVASLGMDESQSLIWEFFVVRSRGFSDYFFEEIQARFPSFRGISKDDVYRWINQVNPASVRINADEVTYDLHILFRFELERALINGELEVTDLPTAWNEKSSELLGHIAEDYRKGVMQDVHWAAGLFGYFPSYTRGHVYAAQLYAQAEKELGDLDDQFARGDFAPLRKWLCENIHGQGSRLVSRELIRNVTGVTADPSILMNYLETKYGSLCRHS